VGRVPTRARRQLPADHNGTLLVGGYLKVHPFDQERYFEAHFDLIMNGFLVRNAKRAGGGPKNG
jgi:hypothetical protein